LWFTIAVPPGHDVQKEVERLAQRAKPLQTIVLPSLRQFKLQLILPVSETVGPTALRGRSARSPHVILPSAPRPQAEGSEVKNLYPRETARCFAPLSMTDRGRVPRLSTADVAAIRELQKDLPASERPFLAAARRAGVSEEALLRRARGLMRRRVMRRFGAILHHRRAGFVANCMTVWAVPRDRIARAGRIAARSPAVSHCYERPSAPGWPYTLFAMIHGRTRAECRHIADQITAQIGKPKRALLFTAKEYKKTRPVYLPGW
jgi:DNA-binding Lrp family transcriptional regulator